MNVYGLMTSLSNIINNGKCRTDKDVMVNGTSEFTVTVDENGILNIDTLDKVFNDLELPTDTSEKSPKKKKRWFGGKEKQ